ncbi:MAG: hypothetical protein M3285_04815 [Actinomycetota bacterium]|nr:hypothetical protein [Actinomycetota bacterium]
MPKITERLEDVRTRAVEMGVYLPLGAYAKVRDQISDLNRQRLQSLFRDLIDRGQVRLQPVERTVRRRGNDAQESARSTVKKTAKRAQAVSAAVAPKLPRVAAPKSASDLPISGYNSLTAADIVSRLQGLTQTDLARVYKYEQTNEDRSTILEAIDSKLIDLPITTYDALTVDEIVSRLDKLTQKELKVIRRYEQDTKARTTILEKLDSLVA